MKDGSTDYIQNSKLVGAVTHVLINDPAKGMGFSLKICFRRRKIRQRKKRQYHSISV